LYSVLGGEMFRDVLVRRWGAGWLSRSLWVEFGRLHCRDVISVVRCACAASQLVVTVKNATVHRQQAVPSYRCVLLG